MPTLTGCRFSAGRQPHYSSTTTVVDSALGQGGWLRPADLSAAEGMGIIEQQQNSAQPHDGFLHGDQSTYIII